MEVVDGPERALAWAPPGQNEPWRGLPGPERALARAPRARTSPSMGSPGQNEP